MQQSHHCGIETCDCPFAVWREDTRSNRTIVGLKPLLLEHVIPSTPTQQSHHCGIETSIAGCFLLPPPRSNRTIVGLKPSQTCSFCVDYFSSNRTIVGLKRSHKNHMQIRWHCSNRTIVGLKPACVVDWKIPLLLQQSHHCGIETRISRSRHSRARQAAIAPLWD